MYMLVRITKYLMNSVNVRREMTVTIAKHKAIHTDLLFHVLSSLYHVKVDVSLELTTDCSLS